MTATAAGPAEPRLSLSRAVAVGRLLTIRATTNASSGARAEALAAMRGLGLLFGKHPADARRSISDLIRATYSGGWQACESRLASPDLADAISTALQTPATVTAQLPGESLHRWQVRAVQRVVAYGAK